MQRYTPFFNDIFSIPSISDKTFNEAVFRTDKYSKILYDYIGNIIEENKNSILKYDYQICSLLTSKFNKYNIIFVPSGTYKNNGILSGINEMDAGTNSLIIRISCALNIGELFKNKNLQLYFLRDFKELISHELVHRAQYIGVKDIKLEKDINKYFPQNPPPKYYKMKFEIMGYACQVVEELRIKGLSDENILSFIKNRESFKNYNCNIYDFYLKNFKNTKTFMKFTKYIYEYLKGDLSKNIIEIGK